MGIVNGGQLVAKMLKREGVNHVFTLSGLHVAPIYAGLVEEGIQVVDMRHEQAAAHAADAYARLRRGIGCAVVTAGPGVTDALTGVANAAAANVPLLLLGGAAPIFNSGRGSLQEMEQVDLFLRITKWSSGIPGPQFVPSYLAKAFRVMTSGRPGPVFLEIPYDVLSNGVDEDEAPLPHGYRTDARSPADPRKLEEALKLLARAERPAVIAGSSIWFDDASDALDRFARKANVPVYLNGAGRGCLPFDHPQFLQHTRKDALSEADVVFVIGTPFDFRMGYGAPPGFSADAKVVQIDGDPTEIGRNRSVDVGIIGDARSVLEQLEAGAGKRASGSGDGWMKRLREKEVEKTERLVAMETSDQTPIHHFRLAKEMSDFFNEAGDPTWIADGGNFVVLAAKSIKLKGPGRWLDPGPLGCLGVGAPFAIAAKLLNAQRPAVIIQGDGSFGLNGFDYETAVRFKLPMVCVVGNDAAWGQIRIPQVQFHGEDKSPATLLSAATRYDKVMEAFGGHGEYVTEPKKIRPALERALASGKPACVNVMLDPDAPLESGSMGYAV